MMSLEELGLRLRKKIEADKLVAQQLRAERQRLYVGVVCKYPGCNQPAMIRQHCARHYQWARKHGLIEPRRNGSGGRPKLFDDITSRLRKIHRNIVQRCSDANDKRYRYYGGAGVKNYLTLDDLRYLWDRDNAAALKQPSIDRKRRGNYTVENCRFIEMDENRKRRFKLLK